MEYRTIVRGMRTEGWETMASQASRRDVIKGALRASAYASPAVVAVIRPLAVSAQVTRPTATSVPTATVVVPAGPRVNVATATILAGGLIVVAGAGFPATTPVAFRQVSGANGVMNAVYGTTTTSATGTFTFSIPVANPVAAGTYVFGFPPSGTTNDLAQITVMFMNGALPTMPVLVVSPASGPAGTNFALLAQGLTAGTRYDLRITAGPTGITPGIIAGGTNVAALAGGQIGFAYDSTGNPAGTYTIGVVPTGTMTVLAQATFTVTSSVLAASGTGSSGGHVVIGTTGGAVGGATGR